MAITLLRPYCTLADVQRETKNSGSELDDTYLLAINLASRFAEGYCRRDFWAHDHSVSPYRVPRNKVLSDMVCLDWPIVSLTEVRVWSRSVPDSAPENALPPESYYFNEGESIITKEYGAFGSLGGFGFSGGYRSEFGSNPNAGSFDTNSGHLTTDERPNGHGYPFKMNMELYGVFGYVLDNDNPLELPPPSIPSAVRRACIILAANWSNQNHKQVIGLGGDVTNLLETRVGPEVKMLLDPWVLQVGVNF